MPICRALSWHGIKIAPRTYWARKTRTASRRALRDALITGMLTELFEPDGKGRRRPESLYGAVKAWDYLRRQGMTVARCTVERLMRARGRLAYSPTASMPRSRSQASYVNCILIIPQWTVACRLVSRPAQRTAAARDASMAACAGTLTTTRLVSKAALD